MKKVPEARIYKITFSFFLNLEDPIFSQADIKTRSEFHGIPMYFDSQHSLPKTFEKFKPPEPYFDGQNLKKNGKSWLGEIRPIIRMFPIE